MKENLVLTIAVGETYEKMAILTHPSIKAYAQKINADFVVIKKSTLSSPHWEKFTAIYNYLNKYKRIFYVDTDVIIREDCPDIFAVVPLNQLALFNEMPFTSQRNLSLYEACKEYGISLPSWNGKYYNTGVMVICRHFKHLFKKPEKEIFNFYEQGFFNAKLFQFLERSGNSHAIFELPYKFNRLTCMDSFTGSERFDSFIIHYAGYPSLEFVLSLIKKDIQRWKQDAPDYKYKKHILINVQGGLGDQICAEPVVRFLREKVYKTEDVIVVTHWPRIFKHLNISVYNHDEFRTQPDTPYYHVLSLPGPTSLMWMAVSHLLCHSVDYIAMALLKRVLPNEAKRIRLPVYLSDTQELIETLGIQNLNDLVLVHAGRHWASKPQPLYSKIKIPNGWKKMGDMKIGNIVCTPDGKTASVIGVYPRGLDKIYRITFYDGRYADCTKDHLWKVYHENWLHNWKGEKKDNPWKILTLEKIIEYRNKRPKKRPMFIPLTNAVYGEKVNLPIDPYVLGCLLGNGCFSAKQSLQFSSIDDETMNNMQKRFIKGFSLKKKPKAQCDYTITSFIGNKGNTYRKILKDMGLWNKNSHTKFIPEIYKEASSEQRLELLQGLMDTDGFAGESKTVCYFTVSPQLALDAQYLVRSLGGLCKVTHKTRESTIGKTKHKITLYTCNIRHNNPEIFFKLSRKKKRAFRIRNLSRKCEIKNIEYIGKYETQCIEIKHPDHLYLTDNFIVTHNTFPKDWWQGVIDALHKEGLKVCLIGQDEETRGTVDVEVRKGMLDTRNLLSFGALIALISHAKVLVSNDSAPVHIAGAFDNGIILIPTCKHPDHILPYRHGNQYFRAKALCKKLMCYEYESSPTTVYGSSAHYLPGKFEEYLPETKTVLEETLKMFRGI